MYRDIEIWEFYRTVFKDLSGWKGLKADEAIEAFLRCYEAYISQEV